MDFRFLPGDLVQHLTGGPKLCVLEADLDGVTCSFWDDARVEFATVTFDPIELAPWKEEAVV